MGAMFYISPKLTFLMLAIVPPVSLGVVGDLLHRQCLLLSSRVGLLWEISEEIIDTNSRGSRRDDQGIYVLKCTPLHPNWLV